MFKRILAGLVSAALVLTGAGAFGTCASFAADSNIHVTVNGDFVTWTDASPYIDSNNRTQVPLRASMEACGLDVDWDAASRTAIVTDNTTTVKVPIGQKYIYVDGVKKMIDTEAVIKNSRTYLPIRAVAEAFGYTVLWSYISYEGQG